MKLPPALLRDLLAAGAVIALAGCAQPIDQRGNLPDPKLLSEIKPGTTDKATVTRLLGSPSSVAAFHAETWYYISQKTKTVAFFKPDLLDQEVVAIDFDQDGTVHDIRHRGMQDAEAITPNPNATPAPGREFSFVEQLIGNFGRFGGERQGTSAGANDPTRR